MSQRYTDIGSIVGSIYIMLIKVYHVFYYKIFIKIIHVLYKYI